MFKDKKYNAIMKKIATKRAKVNVPTYDSKVMMAHWSNGYN